MSKHRMAKRTCSRPEEMGRVNPTTKNSNGPSTTERRPPKPDGRDGINQPERHQPTRSLPRNDEATRRLLHPADKQPVAASEPERTRHSRKLLKREEEPSRKEETRNNEP